MSSLKKFRIRNLFFYSALIYFVYLLVKTFKKMKDNRYTGPQEMWE
jgi:hypothetical protein